MTILQERKPHTLEKMLLGVPVSQTPRLVPGLLLVGVVTVLPLG